MPETVPLAIAVCLSDRDHQAIYDWASSLNWTEGSELKAAESYHITLLYCQSGGQRKSIRRWLSEYFYYQQFRLRPNGLAVFTNPSQYANNPVVLQFFSAALEQLSDKLYAEAQARGLAPVRHDSVFNPHITLGFSTQLPQGRPLELDEAWTGSMGFWEKGRFRRRDF